MIERCKYYSRSNAGNSKDIDLLAEMGAIDVALEIKDKWESFTVQENGGNLIIAGSDKRGTIYGRYDFCENRCVTMNGGRT